MTTVRRKSPFRLIWTNCMLDQSRRRAYLHVTFSPLTLESNSRFCGNARLIHACTGAYMYIHVRMTRNNGETSSTTPQINEEVECFYQHILDMISRLRKATSGLHWILYMLDERNSRSEMTSLCLRPLLYATKRGL